MEIVESVEPVPSERMQDRCMEQMMDSPVPQRMEEIVDGVQCAGVSEQKPQEQIVGVIKPIPRVRVSACVVEQIGHVTVPPVMNVFKVIPKVRVSECVVEQVVNVTVPPVVKILDAINSWNASGSGRKSWR